ncbi:DUF3363 domain-containing protein [Gluconacetobacter azotocaptans]|nr:DUF3363 domain-containing protein [Gluconacetobacter azotocaptans]
MGERGDVVRTMQKTIRAEGYDRDPMSFQIHDAAPATPIVGHVLLATLEAREVARAGSEKFAVVEKSHEFTLVPWRPMIDRQLAREVTGIVQGGSGAWQLGRARGLGI